jgi:hypothetical protein
MGLARAATDLLVRRSHLRVGSSLSEVPGWDEPQVTITEQSTDFLSRIGTRPRPINLEGGDRTDELARDHIARPVRQIEHRIEGQQRFQRYERERRAPALADYEPYAC